MSDLVINMSDLTSKKVDHIMRSLISAPDVDIFFADLEKGWSEDQRLAFMIGYRLSGHSNATYIRKGAYAIDHAKEVLKEAEEELNRLVKVVDPYGQEQVLTKKE